jgi:predicted GNAT family acetyltransferase
MINKKETQVPYQKRGEGIQEIAREVALERAGRMGRKG